MRNVHRPPGVFFDDARQLGEVPLTGWGKLRTGPVAPALLDPTDSFPAYRQTEGDKGAYRAVCELRVAGAMTYREDV
jgi:hypothetical protein